MKTSLCVLTAGAALALSTGLALANDAGKMDLSQAIDLDKVVEIVKQQHPDARIVEAELDDDRGGQWELELAMADGSQQKLELNARTGEPASGKR